MKYVIIIIVISLILSIAVGIIWLWPTYQDFSKLKTQLAQKKIELANQNKYAQQLQEIGEQFDEKKELVDKINNALPISPHISSLLDFLQESAKQTGMSFEDIGWHELTSSEIEKIKTRMREYSVRITASGSYSAFKNFLFVLERSARLIDVVQTDFSLSSEQGKPMSFELILKVRSY